MSFAKNLFNKTVSTVSSTFNSVKDAFVSLPVYHDKRGREYRVKKLLSDAGRFGQCYLAEDGADPSMQYAVKVLSISSENKTAIEREAKVMEILSGHPNIVKLESYFIVDNPPNRDAVFVMELCDGGSLLDILNAHAPRPIAERTVLAVFLEICKAVAHMHSQKPPIAHRDIKIENVLRKHKEWKLCDFGSATTSAGIALDDRTRQRMADDIERNTTMTYRAPEMCDLFRKQLVCEKVDIWALGCMLYKMAFYVDAFEDGTLQILNNRWSIPKTSSYSPEFHELIKFILEPDPDRRPHIGQVCERVAKLLQKPNPVPNFVPYEHKQVGTSTIPSKPATTSDPSKSKKHSSSQQKAAAPAAKAGGGDLFSMLDWADDNNASAPAPATAPASAPKKTSPAPPSPQQSRRPAPIVAPAPQEDFFAQANTQPNKTSPTLPHLSAPPKSPRRASGGRRNPPVNNTVNTTPTAAKAAPQPSVAGNTSFFDNDFTFGPETSAPPAAKATTPTQTSGSFWDNDFCATSTSAPQSKPTSTATSPAPLDDFFTTPVSSNDQLFSLTQPSLTPSTSPAPSTSSQPQQQSKAPAKKQSTAVTVDISRSTSFENDVLSAWK